MNQPRAIVINGRRSTDHLKEGTSHIERRARDRDNEVHVIKLISGDCYFTDKPQQMIVTILGSCVAACLHDPKMRIGGMNHFLLPDGPGSSLRDSGEPARYGAFAMEQLINGIIKLGGVKSRLQAKVFGGGNVINNSAMIGSRNASFVRQFLQNENIPIVSEDLGDTYPRRLRFYPDTGKAMLMKLRRKEDYAVADEELRFAKELKTHPVEGGIELF